MDGQRHRSELRSPEQVMHPLLHRELSSSTLRHNLKETDFTWPRDVAVITSALHAGGRRFDPGRDQEHKRRGKFGHHRQRFDNREIFDIMMLLCISYDCFSQEGVEGSALSNKSPEVPKKPPAV
uniref:Uncharacterized protein n=1 Tax=Ascaris lumbricoides TaxID=6252 RepID=A0A0M3I9F0_ASCLU